MSDTLERDAVIARVLPDYRDRLHTLARFISDDHNLWDDLVQEGYIAMWRALDTHKPERGALPSWLVNAARYRMRDLLSGRSNWTGSKVTEGGTKAPTGTAKGAAHRARIREHLRQHPGATGREIAAAVGLSEPTVSFHRKRLHEDREEQPVVSLDVLLDAGFDPTSAGDLLDGVHEAYFDGVIGQALAELTPNERRYVVLRFWHGADPSELREAFGYEPSGVWRTAKARLAPVLAVLVNA